MGCENSAKLISLNVRKKYHNYLQKVLQMQGTSKMSHIVYLRCLHDSTMVNITITPDNKYLNLYVEEAAHQICYWKSRFLLRSTSSNAPVICNYSLLPAVP